MHASPHSVPALCQYARPVLRCETASAGVSSECTKANGTDFRWPVKENYSATQRWKASHSIVCILGFYCIRLVKETFCSNVFFLTIPPSLLLNQNGSPAVHYDTWLNATPSTFTNYMDATFYPASMNFLISIRATEAVFALCQTRWTDLISNFSALPSSIALFLSSHATVFTPILSSNWFCYWFTWLFYKVPE